LNPETLQVLVLAAGFFGLLFLGAPVAIAIGLASFAALALSFGVTDAAFVAAPQLATGLQSIGLLAIPFFILAGNIMNHGGIARRLVDLARLLVGWLPGAMAHVNVVANMLFGAISGSGVAAAAAIGGLMHPEQEKSGYDRAFSAAVNISSCSTGLLIPPSGALIIYSLASGGTSIAALFVAGYIPGVLMGVSVMIVAGIVAARRGYPTIAFPGARATLRIVIEALPAVALVVVIMGGIVSGAYTATEASGVAVALSLVVAALYRELRLADLPGIVLGSVRTTSIVLFLVATSKAMAFVIAYSDLPLQIEAAFGAMGDNPVATLLAINLALLVVGAFMDMTPAVLIFTPVFLPIAQRLGMDPVVFGIMLIFNLSIGLATPPVGSALFVGASVAGVRIDQLLRPLVPFFFALLIALLMVTFIPALSLWLPGQLGLLSPR
jgi:tripartite ATP-independent transporter DctM subunit